MRKRMAPVERGRLLLILVVVLLLLAFLRVVLVLVLVPVLVVWAALSFASSLARQGL